MRHKPISKYSDNMIHVSPTSCWAAWLQHSCPRRLALRMTTRFAVTIRPRLQLAAWARSFKIVATNHIVGGHPTTFVIGQLYGRPGRAIRATQVMPGRIDHWREVLKCLKIARWKLSFRWRDLGFGCEKKQRKPRTLWNHRLYNLHTSSKFINHHQSPSIINHHIIISHYMQIFVTSSFQDIYCYRQNHLLQTSAPLIRSASKTSMSCSSFCECADSSQVSSCEAFAISILLAFRWVHRDTTVCRCLSRRYQPSTTVASEGTPTLRLTAYTLT